MNNQNSPSPPPKPTTTGPHHYHWDPSPSPRNVHPHTIPRPIKRKPVPYTEKPSPSDRRYCGLRRKPFFITIAVIALILIALIIGLAVGLTLRKNHAQNLPLPTSNGGPYTGDLTYYDPALGACGITSSPNDNIVSVSHFIFDAVSRGSDPNANPLCGLKIRARRGDKSVDVRVVDRCVGCKPTDLDLSPGAFDQLADPSLGRVTGTWAWLEAAPTAAGGT